MTSPSLFLSQFAELANSTTNGVLSFNSGVLSIAPSTGSTLPWSSITSTPTTLSGYGISPGDVLLSSFATPANITSAISAQHTTDLGLFATPASITSAISGGTIGVSQTWQDKTSSRVVGTVYTNTTGKPIQVSVSAYNGTANGQTKLLANSIQVALGEAYSANGNFTLSAIIPNGTTYEVVTVSGSTTILTWAELA